MVNAACERGDCGAFGLECAKDTLGLRCVFSQCPPTGETDVCLDDGHLAHCKDGILGPAGDCGAFAARCSTANAPTGARCVSVFCASSMTEAPHASEGCWPQQPARIASCDADGAFSFTECASGEQCSVVGGTHCEPRFCPATGTFDVCDGDTVAHCVEGQVVSAIDCGASSSRCSPQGGVARCVATACVADVASAPTAHTTCLPSGWLAACDAEGQVTHAEPCIAGASCVESEGAASCVVPPLEGEGSPTPPPTSLGLMAPVQGRGCTTSAGGALGLLALAWLRRRPGKTPLPAKRGEVG